MTDAPLVLGIETSCDETGVGIVHGTELLFDAIASSVDEHARFGGVVPEVASRAHLSASTLSRIETGQRRLALDQLVALSRALDTSLDQLVESEAEDVLISPVRDHGLEALDHADTIFSAGEELLATLRDTARPVRALRVGALSTLSRNFQIAFVRR